MLLLPLSPLPSPAVTCSNMDSRKKLPALPFGLWCVCVCLHAPMWPPTHTQTHYENLPPPPGKQMSPLASMSTFTHKHTCVPTHIRGNMDVHTKAMKSGWHCSHYSSVCPICDFFSSCDTDLLLSEFYLWTNLCNTYQSFSHLPV